MGSYPVEDLKKNTFTLKEGPKYENQYRITLRGIDSCGHSTHISSYVSVEKPTASTTGL